MGNGLRHMKQVLTAVLTAAMIFTSIPQNVPAAEIETDILKEYEDSGEAPAVLSPEEVKATIDSKDGSIFANEEGGTYKDDNASIIEENPSAGIDRDGVSGNITVRFNPSKDVTEITYQECDLDGSAIASPVTLSSGSLTADCTIAAGSRLCILNITCGSGEEDRAYIKKVSNGERYEAYVADMTDPYVRLDLGLLDYDTTVTIDTAKLPISDILINTESGEYVTLTSKVYSAFTTELSGIKYADAYMLEMYDSIIAYARTDNNDPLYNFRVRPNAFYEIEGGSEGAVRLATTTDPKYQYVYIPSEALVEAAFAGKKVNVNLALEKLGYRKQSVKVIRFGAPGIDDKPENVSVRASGEPIAWDNYNSTGEFSYWVPYSMDAALTVNPVPAYTLNKVFYLSDTAYNSLSGNDADKLTAILSDNPPEGVTVIDPQNGSASFTIKAVKDRYQVFVVDDFAYALKVNDTAVTSGTTIDTAYNAGTDARPVISVYQGALPQDLSLGLVSANVTDNDGTSLDVTGDVFGTITGGTTALTFNPTSDKVKDKTVNITISKEAADDDPGYNYALSVRVTGAITAETIDFEGDVTNVLGSETKVTLKTGSDYRPGTVGLELTGAEGLPVTADLAEDGKTVTIKSSVIGKNAADVKSLLSNTGMKLKLYDLNDPAKSPISEHRLTVSAVQVTDTDLAATVKTTPGPNYIRLDMSGAKLDVPDAEGLFFEVSAVRTVSSSQLGDVIRSLVPASKKTGTFRLQVSHDAYEPNSISYDVKVRLVQVTTEDPIGKGDKTARPEDLVAATKAGKDYAESVSTVANGTFPTDIKFNKTKDKNAAKKLYDTVDEEVVIGTVAIGKIGNSYPSSQEIYKVTIDGKSDRTIVKNVWGTITVNPARAGAGTHTIVAYAYQPGGMEVTTKPYKLTIKKGIAGVYVDAPEKVYKQEGKKASFTASVTCRDKDYEIIKKAEKNVTWSLLSDVSPDRELNIPGIKIKKGKVTIDKKVTIPDEGLGFYVCAKANDYAGNETRDYSYVTVHAVSEAPIRIAINGSGTELAEGGTYTSGEVYGYLEAYDEDMNYLPDTRFTVKGLKSTTVNGYKFYYADKPGTKVTVTATRTDGSGLKKKITFSIRNDKYLEAYLTDDNKNEMIVLAPGESDKIINTLAEGRPLHLVVMGSGTSLTEHSISITGGKKKDDVTYDGYGDIRKKVVRYKITPTARDTKIVITEKETGKTVTYEITNTMIAANAAKTSVTGSNKYASSYDTKKKTVKYKDNKGNIFNTLYYANDDEYAATGSCNKVTYTVKSGKSVTGEKKVRISTSDPALQRVFDRNSYKFEAFTKVTDGEYTAELINGQFTIDYSDSLQASDNPDEATFYLPKGSYSFAVTPVNDAGEAAGRAATYKFKAKSAPKGKAAVTAKTFKGFTGKADIGFKNLKNVACTAYGPSVWFSNTYGYNNKGKINSFKTTYGIEDNSKLVCYEVRPGEEKSITGWVEYMWTNLDGSVGTGHVKVTVKR